MGNFKVEKSVFNTNKIDSTHDFNEEIDESTNQKKGPIIMIE